jgi:glycosyltransferase involved in cell wall biosynthesis
MIKNPKFSIILATIERTRELENFLESLKSQTYNNFELIVIDQNTDNRLQPIIDMYSPYIPILLLQEFRRFLVKKADYSKQYNILGLDFL